MRLRLFDRIRRLAHSRRPPAEAAPGVSAAQGRHRRRRRGPATAPAAEPARRAGPHRRPRAERLARTASTVPSGRASRSSPSSSAAARSPPRDGPARGACRGGQGPDQGSARSKPPGRCRPLRRCRRAGRRRRSRPEPPRRPRRRRPARPRSPGSRPASRISLTGRSSWRPAVPVAHAGLPYAAAHPREQPRLGDGRRNCGSLEAVLWRQWDPASPPPREVVLAVDRLAELPFRIKEKLADGLDAIFIGAGGVPELDDMTGLRGVRAAVREGHLGRLCRRLRRTQDRGRHTAVADSGRDVPRGRARAR